MKSFKKKKSTSMEKRVLYLKLFLNQLVEAGNLQHALYKEVGFPTFSFDIKNKEVNVKGDIHFSYESTIFDEALYVLDGKELSKSLKTLLRGFSFGTITGSLYIEDCGLDNMDGFPHTARKIYASGNNIKSLKGMPTSIQKEFDLFGNKITNLEGLNSGLKGRLGLMDNPIRNFPDFPEDFECGIRLNYNPFNNGDVLDSNHYTDINNSFIKLVKNRRKFVTEKTELFIKFMEQNKNLDFKEYNISILTRKVNFLNKTLFGDSAEFLIKEYKDSRRSTDTLYNDVYTIKPDTYQYLDDFIIPIPNVKGSNVILRGDAGVWFDFKTNSLYFQYPVLLKKKNKELVDISVGLEVEDLLPKDIEGIKQFERDLIGTF